MAKRGSRTISVGGATYRWTVSTSSGYLRLIAELKDGPGQRLVAWFLHHDSYVRDQVGRWQRAAQLRTLSPALVRETFLLALKRGWEPDAKGAGVFNLWEAEERFPLSGPQGQGVQLKEVAREIVGDLLFDVSVDVEWRDRLFRSQPGQRFEVPRDNEFGLRFAAYLDGWTPDGMWVIGIESTDFPDVVMHTFNGGGFL
jgi:hypothetical protein